MFSGKHLLVGLTTVFAWTPCTILVLFGVFGLFNSLANIHLLPLTVTLPLILLGLGGVFGYLALTSVCWHLPMSPTRRLVGLFTGWLSLLAAIILGHRSGQEHLMLGMDWASWYFFIGPVVLLGIHLVLQWRSQNTDSSV